MARRRVSASQRLYRARRVGTTFGRIYLGLRAQRFVARRLAPSDMAQRWQRFHEASAQEIYDTAIELEGLILKGCQFLGSRADVLPRAYVETLSRLQDRVPPRPPAVVRRIVEEELGAPVEEIFAEFSPKAVAAASLAQVHPARLPNGRRVAVKVQYPEIDELMRSDLRNIRGLFRAVGLFERDFDLMPLVDELATYMPRELNFVNEGRNAETIGRFFTGRDDVGVPGVHWELTTRRLLVTDYVDGVKISDVEALRALEIDPEAVARLLVEAYCEQILVHGFFHADPHPGNLLVQKLPDGRPRLVFIDFGLAKDLPAGFRSLAVAFAGALISGDVERMAQAMSDLGFETRDGGSEGLRDTAAFILELGQRFRHGVRLDPDFAERFGREVPEAIRRNPIVRIPTDLVLVGRVIGLISGTQRSLGARLDLARTILPYALGKPSRAANA